MAPSGRRAAPGARFSGGLSLPARHTFVRPRERVKGQGDVHIDFPGFRGLGDIAALTRAFPLEPDTEQCPGPDRPNPILAAPAHDDTRGLRHVTEGAPGGGSLG